MTILVNSKQNDTSERLNLIALPGNFLLGTKHTEVSLFIVGFLLQSCDPGQEEMSTIMEFLLA